ncbi:MAG: serine/threonine-protein kinase [Lysobacterales bacterium]
MAELPQIPGYRLLKVLKQSKRSRTFLAEQQSLARQVALKVLSEEFFDDPGLRQRFVDEGKSAARLNHPHVLAVFDIGSAGGFPYIATEFVPGGTLRDRMQQPMAPVEALRIARDLASALDYAHSQGVVHRDIKPSNIMFRGDGAAVLGDLGILKAQSEAGSMQIGSPHYMSPEQIEGESGDGRADLYSLGIVLFEMLTGRPPFDADDPYAVIAKHLSEPVPKLPEAFALYQSLIDKTLAKSAAERYSSAREMVAALDGFIEPKTVREPRTEAMRSTTKPAAVRPAETQVFGAPTVVQAAAAEPTPRPAASPAPVAPAPSAPARSYRQPPKSNLPRAIVRITVVIAVILAVAWGLAQLFGGAAPTTGAGAGTSDKALAQLGGTQGMAEGILAKAERLINEKKWSDAFDTIQQGGLSPANKERAQQVRKKLVQAMADEVGMLRKGGNNDAAESLLAQALKMFPDEPALTALANQKQS